MTSSNRSQTTITSWSYPTTHYEGTLSDVGMLDLQTALTSAVTHLITHGYVPGSLEAKKGLVALATHPETIDISLHHVLGRSIMIWLPLVSFGSILQHLHC